MIGPETTIEHIVRDHPELVPVLMDHGIVCVVCGEPVWGTLEEVAASKGIRDLEPILRALREHLREPPTEEASR
ncbi:MAG: DUF1858 domain-containing protein [Bacteroidetes bacterium]|nr:DUF1858 domain-containing protein [Rhodothermia bacterium]MCS7155101.1 DUF1858 domain-containing protein [Bacteroidota bacterium]MCX7907207.1 DUF1858 domain-containing protein [Bacteroidota bacterium]MDW8138722.1 DUF1858 domain-containing protein [Bacteroidota bacterium]MDW8286057.1 DUF1858 domain-containing protein [Bacteroidota bacterium]